MAIASKYTCSQGCCSNHWTTGMYSSGTDGQDGSEWMPALMLPWSTGLGLLLQLLDCGRIKDPGRGPRGAGVLGTWEYSGKLGAALLTKKYTSISIFWQPVWQYSFISAGLQSYKFYYSLWNCIYHVVVDLPARIGTKGHILFISSQYSLFY